MKCRGHSGRTGREQRNHNSVWRELPRNLMRSGQLLLRLLHCRKSPMTIAAIELSSAHCLAANAMVVAADQKTALGGAAMPLTRQDVIAGGGVRSTSRPCRRGGRRLSRPMPIKMIVPYPAGGTTDLLGRLIADQFKSRSFRRNVFVENKPGAGTALGAERSPIDPDGYTLFDGDLDHAGHRQDALRSCPMTRRRISR